MFFFHGFLITMDRHSKLAGLLYSIYCNQPLQSDQLDIHISADVFIQLFEYLIRPALWTAIFGSFPFDLPRYHQSLQCFFSF